MKFRMYIMASEPMTTSYFINPSHQSVCLYVYPTIVAGQRIDKNSPIVARQRLGKIVTMATNTHATTEELMAASSVWPMSYQKKVDY
jgi:hypothetical protein